MPKRQLYKAQYGKKGERSQLVGNPFAHHLCQLSPRWPLSTQIGLQDRRGRHWLLKGKLLIAAESAFKCLLDSILFVAGEVIYN